MPAPRPIGRAADRGQPGEHGCAAGEGEAERDEAGRAPRLRDRDGVGEAGEELGKQHQRQHEHEPAEHERGPAAPGREHGERHGEQRRDGERAAPAEHLRREPVAPVGEDVELALVVLERAVHLVRRRVDRRGLARDRAQPERDQTPPGRRRRRGPAAPRATSRRASSARAATKPTSGMSDEERVGRVDRARARRSRRRSSRARRATVRRRRRRRARSRPGRSSCRLAVAGSASAVYEPPLPAASAKIADRRGEHREPAPGRAEDLLARLPGDEERDRHEHARLVQNDRRRVDAGEPGDEREERSARAGTRTRGAARRPGTRRRCGARAPPKSSSFRTRARWKRSSPPVRCPITNQSAIPKPTPATATPERNEQGQTPCRRSVPAGPRRAHAGCQR